MIASCQDVCSPDNGYGIFISIMGYTLLVAAVRDIEMHERTGYFVGLHNCDAYLDYLMHQALCSKLFHTTATLYTSVLVTIYREKQTCYVICQRSHLVLSQFILY